MRTIRTRRGLIMRDVERGCAGIAFITKYFVRCSQLSSYENGKLVPSIFELYALSQVYHSTMTALVNCYLPIAPRRKK